MIDSGSLTIFTAMAKRWVTNPLIADTGTLHSIALIWKPRTLVTLYIVYIVHSTEYISSIWYFVHSIWYIVYGT